MPGSAPIPVWRVNAYQGGRSIDFQHEFGKLQNITSGTPTEIGFTAGCAFKTLVQCFAEPNGKGHMASVNVPANSKFPTKFPTGAFASWIVHKRQ